MILSELFDNKIHNTPKLDQLLVKLCALVVQGKRARPDHYGMVAACIVDPDNQVVYGINEPDETDHRIHAERVAIDRYHELYGEIPSGSIIVTTLSPCSQDMAERHGDSCTDLINQSGVKKVYAGYMDPTQDTGSVEFTLQATKHAKITDLCKMFADTFLDESAAWRRKAGKNKNGGLNAKGVASYRRENPGSKLQTAVTTKPSKLKPGSKAAKRRKSFCARMSGVDGPMEKPNGEPTRKALALRKWNC
jgi:pyrimidine deaminase RibD-like protein